MDSTDLISFDIRWLVGSAFASFALCFLAATLAASRLSRHRLPWGAIGKISGYGLLVFVGVAMLVATSLNGPIGLLAGFVASTLVTSVKLLPRLAPPVVAGAREPSRTVFSAVFVLTLLVAMVVTSSAQFVIFGLLSSGGH